MVSGLCALTSLLLCLLLVLLLMNRPIIADPIDNLSNQRFHFWTREAIQYIEEMNCDETCFAEPKQCQKIKERLLIGSNMNVYTAEASSRQRKLIAQLADSRFAGEQDGVLALDPYPEAEFGHPILLFFIQRINKNSCKLLQGAFIENQGDCMFLAKKPGCHSSKHRLRKKRLHSFSRPRSCQIDLLPSVYEVNVTNAVKLSSLDTPQTPQLLRCRELPGFASCPLMRSGNATKSQCDTAPCHHNLLQQLHTRCRLFEKCDHGMILHGGWNQLLSRQDHLQLVRDTRQTLLRYGFSSASIKTFFGNGISESEGQPIAESFPAYKTLFRQYIHNVCQKQYCVDSFTIFIQGPALSNGDLLLWDRNDDATADREERYSYRELLNDVANCGAERVHIIIDHPYSGKILASSRLRRKERYSNTKIFVAGKHQTKAGEFTRQWLHADHNNNCMNDIFESMKILGSEQTLNSFDGNQNQNSNIFGAPCNLEPKFAEQELSQYRGCHSVPTLLWFGHMNSAHIGSQSMENSIHFKHKEESEEVQTRHRFRHRRTRGKLETNET